MTEFSVFINALNREGVEYVIIGGFAGNLHGTARVTFDLDVVYRRTRENCQRIVAALAPLHPYLRGAPPGLPFLWDADTLMHGLNFTLRADPGDIDLLGEISGVGFYENIAPRSVPMTAFDFPVKVIDLMQLIAAKRAAARRKDLEAIAELEALLEEKGGTEQ